jgi:hypothetical protein
MHIQVRCAFVTGAQLCIRSGVAMRSMCVSVWGVRTQLRCIPPPHLVCAYLAIGCAAVDWVTPPLTRGLLGNGKQFHDSARSCIAVTTHGLILETNASEANTDDVSKNGCVYSTTRNPCTGQCVEVVGTIRISSPSQVAFPYRQGAGKPARIVQSSSILKSSYPSTLRPSTCTCVHARTSQQMSHQHGRRRPAVSPPPPSLTS